jgi:heme exporter protein C
MNLKKIGLIVTAVAAVLVLVTTYLAVYYAPLPGTSVKEAEDIMPSIEGTTVTLSGFITGLNISDRRMVDSPAVIEFSLADFVDYQRYEAAVAAGNTSSQWWTVRPVDVKILSGGYLVSSSGPDITDDVHNTTNISLSAVVTAGSIGDNSLALGYYLYAPVTSSVIISSSQGGFSAMTAPIAQKIFYFHMPSAWASYMGFIVTMVASVLYLRTRDVKYDWIAMSSAELGVLFATIAITTGPVWAKQEWGVYWRWDDTKLVTTFIMWLVYIGYLSLRAAMPEPMTKARVSAVYGIVGFVTMPMSLLSSRIAPLLNSSHPEVIASSTGSLSAQAGLTVGIAVVAFTFLFVAMLIKRFEIAENEEELEELKRIIGGEE